MAARTLFTVALLVAIAALAVESYPPSGARFINLDPWSWLPTKRQKSTSIMDYFFPPSRTPKSQDFPPKSLQEIVTTKLMNRTETTIPATKSPIPTTNEIARTSAKVTSTATTRAKSSSAFTTRVTPEVTYETTFKQPNEKYLTTLGEPDELTTEKSTGYSSQQTTYSGAPYKSPTSRLTTLTTAYETTVPDVPSSPKVTVQSTVSETKTSPLASTHTETTTVKTSAQTLTFETTDDERQTETVPSTVSLDTQSTRVTLGTSRSTPEEDRGSSTPALATVVTGAPDPDSREGYYQLKEKAPVTNQVKINEESKKETVPLPAGSTSVLAKPTKYHYYPHNQHIYLLPECAIQQVCNAVYVRLNYTQPLCACPSRYRDPCSASLNADDLHTTRLTTNSKKKYASKAVTLVKTCEAVAEMRECRAPRDWSLLALQNIRTGKSHYLVICRCPENHVLEGPMSHDQPTYASVPGIRVYGMMCVRPTVSAYNHQGYNTNKYPAVTIQSTTSSYKVDYSQSNFNQDRPSYNRYQNHNYAGANYFNRMTRSIRHNSSDVPAFPWQKAYDFAKTIKWD